MSLGEPLANSLHEFLRKKEERAALLAPKKS